LKYGMQDIAADLVGRQKAVPVLRPSEFFAVQDISFELRQGECLGLIGRNGAGKTTALKMLNGLIKPDGGQITVRGRVGALIALGAGFNPLLSGRENIYVNGAILGMSKGEIAAKLQGIIDFAELHDFIDAPVQSYSSGMVVRLGFAVAVHCEPDSLLLDEVLAVGDAAFQVKCYNTLSKFRERGVGFILVSHNMSHIDCYCDRVVYLKEGRSVFVGDTRSGLAEYNRDMLNEGETTSAAGVQFEKACGSGKVIITRISFLDTIGREVSEISAGASVTLRIQYECASSEAVPTAVDVYIKDQGGVFFHDPHAAECEDLAGRGCIDVMFEAIPANNQRLFFSIGLMGLDSWEQYDWKSGFPLTVHGTPRSQGRVDLSFDWKVVREEVELTHAGV
jgi:lipopolysaccharide transport system ATP-binding protein